MFNRKLFFTIFFIVLFFLPQNFVFAQTQFEGKIKIKISEDGKSQLMDYMVKGQKFRFDLKDVEEVGAMIFDSQSKKMMIVMPQQKMYMEMPLDLSEAESYFEDESFEGKITMTGEKKVIKGYECEKWIVEDEGYITESWITDKLGGFMFMGNPMGGGGSDWKSKLNAQNYFPMEVNVYESGKLVNTIEVVEVAPQNLDNSLFSAPSGFQKFEMPSFNLEQYK
ncbi:MAG: DUF4412 domain-containing protein [Ignavibacteriaceae bacterium]